MHDTTKIQRATEKLKNLRIENWQEFLFTTKWWLLLTALMIAWVLFIFLHKKENFLRTVLCGTFVALLSTVLDQIGASFVLWIYPLKLIPNIATFLPASLGIIPVSFMLIYQYFNFKTAYYYAAVLIFSGLSAYVGEPLLTHYGFYKLIQWNYHYSFLITIGIGSIAREITNRIPNTDQTKNFIK